MHRCLLLPLLSGTLLNSSNALLALTCQYKSYCSHWNDKDSVAQNLWFGFSLYLTHFKVTCEMLEKLLSSKGFFRQSLE